MKELKYIHITKCAGSTIEDIGKENNIYWGRFHHEYGWWHECFPRKNINLKNKYDWFVIVRNPYDRIISEFYCNYGGIGKTPNLNDEFDVTDFNNYIKKKILMREKGDHERGDHYTEQHKYIDENVNIHVIHFENIHIEFKELMKKYNLHLKIDRHCNKPTLKRNFTVESFSSEVIKLINNIYHKDFEMFHYDKIKII